ncbi:Na+/H+ antiporter NhaA [Geothermobacter hydrogeniphilus]|uniref:Na(+)/H(+) antiporter NhaA n=1 Tax=Geothermobacter hydrogeniphilus TaxID=1969733 RepID=A0A1X0Y681_9BACT|nr:Na+/H+ antiporter NhaA [Geothermobacter hydrogeniphilus]ORJ60655.1 Na+/H+ antiporter NhaA [Geothermobacter hydrogeniphilus]
MSSKLEEFLQKESSVGILLMVATVLAMVCANSSLQSVYEYILNTPFEVRLGRYIHIAKPLLLLVNDGLMAIFFLLVGLEVKREVMVGQLSSRAQIILPGIAALGGMIAPALCYVLINIGDSAALNGWAIPAATDIAFALGVLALLGKRVPSSLKIFLLALAIMDDLGAIIIIALFYSGDLSISMLWMAAICLVVLFLLNIFKVERMAAYITVGVFLWIFVLKSGVHATLAGVALAFAIPLKSNRDESFSPAGKLEHDLHPWVSFLILPIFAFANAGIPLSGMGLGDLFHSVPLGIMVGLVVGKLAGVYGCSILAVKTGLAAMPEGATNRHLFGVAALCGIGFTMSLFIGGLAFEHVGGDAEAYMLSHRLGILTGSLISGLLGYFILLTGGRAVLTDKNPSPVASSPVQTAADDY